MERGFGSGLGGIFLARAGVLVSSAILALAGRLVISEIFTCSRSTMIGGWLTTISSRQNSGRSTINSRKTTACKARDL
nr:MAG TPA: hypothetical protein [Caudoviricetes sp.]